MRSTLLVLLVSGCSYETIEDACRETVPGDRWAGNTPTTLFQRVNCHRRFVGLAAGKITKFTQAATDAHANYLEVNGVLDPESENFAVTLDDIFVEEVGLPGFTGATIFDRLAAQNAFDAADLNIGTWDVILGEVAEDEVDDLLYDPWLRDVFFQPLWYSSPVSTGADAVSSGSYDRPVSLDEVSTGS
jgi:hypothetical protein